jgi:hypothetical protein
MRFRRLACLVAVMSAASAAPSADAMKGKLTCASSPEVLSVLVGDAPDHKLSLSRHNCQWSPAIDIGPFKTSQDSLTIVSEMRGDAAENKGYETINMSNGDRLSVRYSGITSISKGSGQGGWHIASGEGRYRGISGSGSYHSTLAKDGALTIEFDGHYTLQPETAVR